MVCGPWFAARIVTRESDWELGLGRERQANPKDPSVNAILSRLFGASLFHREPAIATPWAIVGWWEVRRVPFNLIVGMVGIVTVATGSLAMSVTNAFLETPLHRPDPPLFFFALIYALVVNLFYTGGWLAELLWRRMWGGPHGELATLSFRLGLLFSILITLLPAVIAVAFAVHAIVTRRPLIAP